MSQLTTTEKECLQTIVDSQEIMGVMASNLLCFGYNQCQDFVPTLPEMGGNQQRFAKPNVKQLLNDLQNTLVTHPNPAKNFVVFDYSLAATDAQISITDVTGKLIHTINLSNTRGETIWDTREVTAGMYFYSVNANGRSIILGKVIIEK
jgi:hypothetical protein